MNDSHHIHNERCPSCTEKGNDKGGDNLGVYSDGHAYCWSCGFFRVGKFNFDRGIRESFTPPIVKLPLDCDIGYPQIALDWVSQYDITQDDLVRNGVMWSWEGSGVNIKGEYIKAESLLIFPVFEGGNLIAWQGRYFGHNINVPKYVGRGKTADSLCIINGRSRIDDTLVMVEDVMSAIKVAKAGWDTLPLFGTKVKSRLERLRILKRFKLAIWLDPNMHTQSIQYRRVAALEGFKCHSVLSTKDPKEHAVKEIREYLK